MDNQDIGALTGKLATEELLSGMTASEAMQYILRINEHAQMLPWWGGYAVADTSRAGAPLIWPEIVGRTEERAWILTAEYVRDTLVRLPQPQPAAPTSESPAAEVPTADRFIVGCWHGEGCGDTIGGMTINPSGSWVQYEDYSAALRENARLRAELEVLHTHMQKVYPVRDSSPHYRQAMDMIAQMKEKA